MRSALLMVVMCLVCASGCASPSPVAPSSDTAGTPATAPQLGTLTVNVRTRGTEQPIEGASVQTARTAAVTNHRGECVLTMALGEEVEVSVSAAGFEPMIAAAAPNSSEHWTFYLKQASN